MSPSLCEAMKDRQDKKMREVYNLWEEEKNQILESYDEKIGIRKKVQEGGEKTAQVPHT